VESKELERIGEFVSALGGKILLKVFEEEKIETVLRVVQSRNGKIHSLIPRTETLEDLFVGMVKQR